MKVRKILRKLGLSLLALLVFGVGAELCARWAEPGPMSLFDTNPYLPDATLGHVHKPDFQGRWDSTWYGTDSQGRRGSESPPTFAPEEYRVVALGDSCTFGKGVREQDSWPRQLEARLGEVLGPGRTPRVYNLGVNGYALWQYQRVLELQVRQLKPHLVIVGYNVNDYDDAANVADGMVFAGAGVERPPTPPPEREPSDRAAPPPQPPAGGSPPALEPPSPREPQPAAPVVARKDSLRQRLRKLLPQGLRDDLNRLALYRFLRASYYDRTRERDYLKMAAIVNELRNKGVRTQAQTLEREVRTLERLVHTAQGSGGRVVLFLFPFEAMVYVDDFDRQTERFVQQLAERAGVEFVDVPQAFRDRLAEVGKQAKLFVRGDRYHPNPRGYDVVARALVGGIDELGWLGQGE